MTTIARAALPFLVSPPLLSSVSSPPLPSPSSPSPSSSSFPPHPSPSSSSYRPLPSSSSLLRPLSSWPVPPDVGLGVPPVPSAAGRQSSGQGPRAQSGAYMWWKGRKSVKTGSKPAKNTCLSMPNGPGSLLEKYALDPFLTHFWSQNGPLSRHFGIFYEPKPLATGSKWAKTTCLSIINGPGSFLEKRVFDPFLTHCWSQNGPFSRHFGIFHGP